MTAAELAEMLKDPEIAKQVVAMTSPKAPEKPTPPPKAAPKKPVFKMPDDPDKLPEALETFTAAMSDYADAIAEFRSTAVEEKVTQKDKAAEAKKLKDFSEKHPLFKDPDMIKVMEPLYNTGNYTVEQVYDMAQKSLGKKEEVKEDKTTTKRSPSVSSTDESATPDKSELGKPKAKDLRGVIAQNLETTMKAKGLSFDDD